MKKVLFLLPMMLFTSCVLVVGDEDAHFDFADDNYHHVSNNAVAERVEDTLYADESIHISDLHVTSKDGVVYLRGNTRDPQTVTRAVSLAMADAEVQAVKSRIVVNAEKY